MNPRLTLLFLISTVYALIRYVILGNSSPAQIPVYILNKSISMTVVGALAFNVWYHVKKEARHSRYWGRIVVHGSWIHILLSLTLLSPAYYPKFFSDAKFTVWGGLVFLFGTLTAYLFWRLSGPGHTAKRPLLKWALLCLMVHLIGMGIPGWIQPGTWNGLLPPISLLCFLVVLIAFIFETKPSGP